jgi:type II secretory pathway component PulM
MEQMAADHTSTVTQAQQWASRLAPLAVRLGQHFSRAEPRRRAMAYIQGLVSPIERKNG